MAQSRRHRLILNDDRLPPAGGEPIREHARTEVGAGACTQRYLTVRCGQFCAVEAVGIAAGAILKTKSAASNVRRSLRMAFSAIDWQPTRTPPLRCARPARSHFPDPREPAYEKGLNVDLWSVRLAHAVESPAPLET
jgi:hypothetical protein